MSLCAEGQHRLQLYAGGMKEISMAVTASLLDPAAWEVKWVVWGSQSLPSQNQTHADQVCSGNE